jgi:hypothetical protein
MSNITGTWAYYGGGGAGGGYVLSHGSAGLGGGGSYASAGAANTGGGGGGDGNGGSGVSILRILTSIYTGLVTGSPTVTTDGLYTVLKFTSSGTYTA